MRTQEEILQRIPTITIANDIFGVEKVDLISALNYENAKPFLNNTDEDEWEPITDFKKEMKDYMDFALDKAINERGLSAYRSLSHYRAWLWLDGDEEIWPNILDYTGYGMNKLLKICKYLEIDPDDCID